MDRRELIGGGAMAVAAAAAALPAEAVAAPQRAGRHPRPGAKLQIGIIGVGMRGAVHLEELLKRDDVAVTAIADIDPFMIERARATLTTAGQLAPQVYTGSTDAWRELIAKSGVDAVLIVTPWELHAPMAIAAMEAGIAVGSEVVAGITLDDHWQVLNTQLRTGTPYMLLENVCYRRDVLAALNMARQGLFGEIVHVEGGYQHDLRAVKFNAGFLRWDPAVFSGDSGLGTGAEAAAAGCRRAPSERRFGQCRGGPAVDRPSPGRLWD